MLVDLAGDVALEDAGDLSDGLALSQPSGDVVASWLVVQHAGDDDSVQRAVGLSVAATVQSMPDGLSRRRRDGGYPAQVCPRCFATEPLRVVAGCDQKLRSCLKPHAE